MDTVYHLFCSSIDNTIARIKNSNIPSAHWRFFDKLRIENLHWVNRLAAGLIWAHQIQALIPFTEVVVDHQPKMIRYSIKKLNHHHVFTLELDHLAEVYDFSLWNYFHCSTMVSKKDFVRRHLLVRFLDFQPKVGTWVCSADWCPYCWLKMTLERLFLLPPTNESIQAARSW